MIKDECPMAVACPGTGLKGVPPVTPAWTAAGKVKIFTVDAEKIECSQERHFTSKNLTYQN